jgi:hypothetical protein
VNEPVDEYRADQKAEDGFDSPAHSVRISSCYTLS